MILTGVVSSHPDPRGYLGERPTLLLSGVCSPVMKSTPQALGDTRKCGSEIQSGMVVEGYKGRRFDNK